MIKGVVKEYDRLKGIGFITGQDGEDYFVHVSGLREYLKEKGLRIGQRVSFDIDYDIYEPFLDYGIDQVTSTFESGSNGAVWNSQGKQNNNSHNSFSNVTYEKFDDFGNDGIADGQPGDFAFDDYNIDPNEDNYNVLTNSTGTELSLIHI